MLTSDASNLNFRKSLAMPLMLLIMLASTQLENFNLLAETLRDNFGSNLGTRNEWRANFQCIPLADS